MRVQEKLDNAIGLLRRALGTMDHEPRCSEHVFRHENRHCPANHPIWRHTPDCDCIVNAIAKFLNEN